MVHCRGGHLQASGVKRLSFAYFSLPRQRKVGAAPHRGDANRPIRKQGKANTTSKQTKKPPARQKATTPKPAQQEIPIYESSTHILEVSKNPPYNPNTKPARRRQGANWKVRASSKQQAASSKQQAASSPPSRQRGKKNHARSHTPCVRRGSNDRRQPAMPTTVRQQARTRRVPSRFSGRQAGPAR